jgi:hypothetical protein
MNMILHANFSAETLPGTDEWPSTIVAIAWKYYVEAIREGLIDDGPEGWHSFLCGWMWMEWRDAEQEGDDRPGDIGARVSRRGTPHLAAAPAPASTLRPVTRITPKVTKIK